jgi:serine/threonine-protein kinase RsbW
MAAATSLKLVIPSQVRLVEVVHRTAEGMAEVTGFEESDALNLALAVREVVINAIMHGNRSDPGRSVEVVLETNAEGLRARITDQGTGFDPEATPDPTLEENRLRTSGRGLLLVRSFVDDVKFRFVPGTGMEVSLLMRYRHALEETGS